MQNFNSLLYNQQILISRKTAIFNFKRGKIKEQLVNNEITRICTELCLT